MANKIFSQSSDMKQEYCASIVWNSKTTNTLSVWGDNLSPT